MLQEPRWAGYVLASLVRLGSGRRNLRSDQRAFNVCQRPKAVLRQ